MKPARPDHIIVSVPRGSVSQNQPRPLFSNSVFYALLAVFGIFLMLTADWFELLLLNSEGVFQRIGPLNTVRVTAVMMTGIAIPSALLMFHYKRLYSYTSDENIFFASTNQMAKAARGGPIKIVVWNGYVDAQGENFTALMNQYNKEHPDVEVTQLVLAAALRLV